MSELPRPQDQTIINVQKQEIDRVNDNRVVLIAMLEEMKQEAEREIARLGNALSVAMSRLDEEGRAAVESVLNGQPNPLPPDALVTPSRNGASVQDSAPAEDGA